MSKHFRWVGASPAETGDGPGGELLDPFAVFCRFAPHVEEEPVSLEGRVGVQVIACRSVHEVVAEFALAFPGFGPAEESEVVAAGSVIREVRNGGTVRVDGGALGKQVVGDLLRGNPHVDRAKHGGLVNRTVGFAPFVKLDPRALFGNIVYSSNVRESGRSGQGTGSRGKMFSSL